jgi:glycosyltransferase involved in cell wall biosynthesis
MKNVLMIVPFFPPNGGGGVFRALSFVKYLTDYGWQPTVVTPRPESYWVTDKGLLDDVPASCDVHRTKTLSGQSLLGLLRRGGEHRSQVRSSRRFGALRSLGVLGLIPDTYVGWYPFATKTARRLIAQQRFDAIFSTSPPETSHLIGHKLHRSTGIPWLADFRDPWTHLYVHDPMTPIHKRIHLALEKKVCINAMVVVTNRRHKEQLQERFPGMSPPRVISNGYDHRKFEAYSNLAPPDDRCRVLHTGMLTHKRNAATFLEGLKIFLDSDPRAVERLEVLLVGPREDENDRMVQRLGLESVVSFRDTVPHDESLRLAHASHILLVIALEHQMPGKFFEYIGARRPILAIVRDGEVRDIVSRLRRGEIASIDNSQEIAERIGMLYAKYFAGTLESDYDLSVVPDYQRDKLTATLAACLNDLTE